MKQPEALNPVLTIDALPNRSLSSVNPVLTEHTLANGSIASLTPDFTTNALPNGSLSSLLVQVYGRCPAPGRQVFGHSYLGLPGGQHHWSADVVFAQLEEQHHWGAQGPLP